jgi:hypothetical protein
MIVDEIAGIYDRIKKPIARDPVGLLDELEARCVWLARSAELVADCQGIADKARGVAAEKAYEMGYGGNLAKDYITGVCCDETRLLRLAEKVNTTIMHQMDSIRTMVSFEKQQLAEVNRGGTSVRG